ncbi:hypothetical protein [Kribbella sp. NPDC051718]
MDLELLIAQVDRLVFGADPALALEPSGGRSRRTTPSRIRSSSTAC